ncbi:MAG: hypothetical protein WBP72_06525, partial [Rhodocyclaceae bacterium]
MLAGNDAGDLQDDIAALSEFDGVAEEVHQDLAQPNWVASHTRGQLRSNPSQEFQALCLRTLGNHLAHFIDQIAQDEIDFVEFQLARFDLGEIEYLVEGGQQRLGRALGHLAIAALLVVQVRFQHQRHHPEHPVHRRADLVTHVGEKLGFGHVGHFRLVFGRTQCRVLGD